MMLLEMLEARRNESSKRAFHARLVSWANSTQIANLSPAPKFSYRRITVVLNPQMSQASWPEVADTSRVTPYRCGCNKLNSAFGGGSGIRRLAKVGSRDCRTRFMIGAHVSAG